MEPENPSRTGLPDVLAGDELLDAAQRVGVEDGYEATLLVETVDDDAPGGVLITCSVCGAQGRIPIAPDPMPDFIRCPDCMKERIARGQS